VLIEGTFVTMRAQKWQQAGTTAIHLFSRGASLIAAWRAPVRRRRASPPPTMTTTRRQMQRTCCFTSAHDLQNFLAHHDASPAACLSGKSREPRPSCA